ncbi:MAG: flavodoxin domain-containing protein, partial [Duncaniella sp.]|nr:flavodoxin domain-containing protein [Duncaniella sp.]
MIIYFSGTGNSRAVATELGRLTDEEVKAMTPSMRGGDIEMTDSQRLIWVFPVYSWGVPPYVLDII